MTLSREKEKRLPPGWRWVELGQVCDFRHGSTPSKANKSFWNGDILWVSPKDMYSDVITSSQDRISSQALRQTRISEVPEGTVLIVIRSGVLAHTLPVAIAGRHLTFNQDIKAVLPHPNEINSDYLRWQLLFHEPYILAHGIKQGATVHSIRSGFFEGFQIPLPPLNEQRRITAILKEQMASVEKARAAAQERLAAVKALPASFLRQVFPRPGQPLPDGWRLVRLGDISILLASKSIASDGDTEIEAITTACLSEMGFQPSGTKPARMWSKDVEVCSVTKGEVLIARSNTLELVGRASLFDGPNSRLVASDLTIRIQAGSLLLPDYLARYLSHLFISGYWRDHAGGASGSMKKITRTQVLGIKIPLPQLAEQKRIAAVLQDKIAALEKARAAAEDELATINALPASLLRRAFNGEL